MTDKRLKRTFSIRYLPEYFSLDIHKSMFIKDLMITIPKYYVESWGEEVIDSHDRTNYKWKVKINYTSPRDLENKKFEYKGTLTLGFSRGRSKESSYRLKWDKSFAIRLAKDYPKSFVRSLEYYLGDEYYKKMRFSEYDIGGFKEQLQVKINWKNEQPIVSIRELFKAGFKSQMQLC